MDHPGGVSSFIESCCILTGLGMWIHSAFGSLPISLNVFPKDELARTIASNDVCPFSLDVDMDGLYVSNFSQDSSISILKAKIVSLVEYAKDSDNILAYTYNQLKMMHLFEEVIVSYRFLMLFFLLIFLAAIIDLVVIGPIVHFVEDIRTLHKVEDEKNTLIWRFFRSFIAEKITVLAFVIVQKFDDTSIVRVRFKDLSNFMDAKFDVVNYSSDATVFGTWFCFVGFVLLVTLDLNVTFEKTIRHGVNLKNKLSGDASVRCAFIVSFFMLIFSMYLLFMSLCSSQLVNSYYFLLLVCDAFRCWLCCMCVLLRIYYFIVCSNSPSLPNEVVESDNETNVNKFLLKGGNYSESLKLFKRVHDIVAHAVCILQYSILAYIGLSINGKLAALILTRKLSHHIRQFSNSLSTKIPIKFDVVV